MEFNLPDGYTFDQLTAAQIQLKLDARLICDILDNAGFKYCLAFGSLLGAVRHRGFIPWDDDLDLFIFDEYYDLAVDVLKRNLPTNLIVHSNENDPYYYHCWNRVKNLDTTVTSAGLYNSDNDLLKYKCLSIDLYRLPLIRYCELSEYIEREAVDFWQKKFDANIISEHEKEVALQNVEAYVTNKMKTISQPDFSSEQLVRFFCMVMKKPVLSNYFDKLHYAPFEDTKFYIPEASDVVLEAMYGDYLVLPEIDQRRSNLTSFVKHSRVC
jgi:lipopolysaccharide cholinephosphotransferase